MAQKWSQRDLDKFTAEMNRQYEQRYGLDPPPRLGWLSIGIIMLAFWLVWAVVVFWLFE